MYGGNSLNFDDQILNLSLETGKGEEILDWLKNFQVLIASVLLAKNLAFGKIFGSKGFKRV